jgi:hypothetical protein
MKKVVAALLTATSSALAMAAPVAVAPPAHACTVVGTSAGASVWPAMPGEACTGCVGVPCMPVAGNAGPVWAPAYVGEAGCYPLTPWLDVCQG